MSSNQTPAVHGQIHWRADDKTAPPSPVKPPPAELWRASGALPATGNYVYFESQAGDPVGGGKNNLYTQADAVLSVRGSSKMLAVDVTGDETWRGYFEVMAGGTLEPAYFGNAQIWPIVNPTRPAVQWAGATGSCYKISGWFAVDAISLEADQLKTLDLRFEQHCSTTDAVLHGQIHWSANDPTRPPGPVDPPPADLWKPPAGVVPASGNFAYFESETGDFVGGGKVFQYPSTTPLTVTSSDDAVAIRVDDWLATFAGMAGIGELAPGYYGPLDKPNPTRGSLNVSGQGHGCTKETGWFVVDNVAYANGKVTAIELRFEQHCDGKTPALRGLIRYAAP